VGHSCASPGFGLIVADGCGMGQSDDAMPVVTRKPCILYHKLTEVIEVVQTQFIFAGFAAVTELALFSAFEAFPTDQMLRVALFTLLQKGITSQTAWRFSSSHVSLE